MADKWWWATESVSGTPPRRLEIANKGLLESPGVSYNRFFKARQGQIEDVPQFPFTLPFAFRTWKG